MAGINDIMIDATTSEGINDVMKKSDKEVNVNRVVVGGNGSKGKTIIPQRNISKQQTESNERVSFDISSLKQDEEEEKNISKSITDDILSGKNPILKNYIENKTKEMQEWVAEKEDEEELKKSDNDYEDSFEDDEVTYDSLGSMSLSEEYLDDWETTSDEEVSYDQINNDINFDDTENNIDEEVSEPTKEENKKEDVISSDIELDDLGTSTTNIDFEDDEDEQEEAKEEVKNDEDDTIKHLQKIATERLQPVSKKLNISSYTLVKKPTVNTKFLQQKPVKVAKWVLPNQEAIVLMKEFLGSELEQLRVFSSDRNSVTSLTGKFRTIYDHIASPKPTTYEAWIKSTPWSDVDHYFFAIYVANFKGSNYIPVDCPNDKCKETYLSEDIPVMEMVKFEDEKSKAKFQKIYQNETVASNPKGLYTTEIIPLSETIAIGFKEPSIYNLIEIASLDNRFRERYSSVLNYIPYIDALYIIDHENQNIIPIGYKGYADNATKTIKSKIQKFDSILRTLSADEFGVLDPYIQAIVDRKAGYGYQFPAITCPKCGTVTEVQPVSAEDMVFTRCQLGKLVTTSLN